MRCRFGIVGAVVIAPNMALTREQNHHIDTHTHTHKNTFTY